MSPYSQKHGVAHFLSLACLKINLNDALPDQAEKLMATKILAKNYQRKFIRINNYDA